MNYVCVVDQNANENSHSALSKLNTMATCEHFSLTMECKQFILQLTSEKEPTKIFMHTNNIPTESDVKVQQLVQYPQQVEQPVIISDNDTAAPTTTLKNGSQSIFYQSDKNALLEKMNG